MIGPCDLDEIDSNVKRERSLCSINDLAQQNDFYSK
jgi:hypothetical protein